MSVQALFEESGSGASTEPNLNSRNDDFRDGDGVTCEVFPKFSCIGHKTKGARHGLFSSALSRKGIRKKVEFVV